MNEIALA